MLLLGLFHTLAAKVRPGQKGGGAGSREMSNQCRGGGAGKRKNAN